LYTTKLTIIILEVILVYKISLVSTSVYFVYLTTMNWHLLSIIHLLLGLACLITSVILFRLREYPEIRNFSLHIFISAIWLFAYSMQLSSSTLDDLLLWESIAFSAMFFIPATYHYTTLRFIGYLRRVKWHQLVIIFLPSVLFTFTLFTNEYHGLFWTDVRLLETGKYTLIEQTFGPGFWVFFVIASILVLVTIFIILYVQRSSKYYYAHGTMALLWAGLLTNLTAAGDFLGYLDFLQFSPTGFVLAISSLLITINIFKMRNKEILNISNSALMEISQDGLLVLDPFNTIVNFNDFGLSLLNTNDPSIKGQCLESFWPELYEIVKNYPDLKSEEIVELKNDDNDQIYQVNLSDLRDWKDHLLCKIIVLKNITEFTKRNVELSEIIKSSNLVSTSLDLGTVLSTIAGQLSNQGKFHRCEIYIWDDVLADFRSLVEYSRIFRADQGSEIYSLSEYPTTKEVITSGKPILIDHSTDNVEEEIKLLDEMGHNSLIITPLWSGPDVIGVAEMSSNIFKDPLDARSIPQAIKILKTAAEWIRYPLDSNQEERFQGLANRLLNTTGCSLCSFSYWERDEDTVNTFLEYSNSIWNPGEGPKFHIEESPKVQKIISNIETPMVINISDPELDEIEQSDMTLWGSKSKLYLPLKIQDRIIGIIELNDAKEERDIPDDQLNFLKALGDQAAISIHNAQLYFESQNKLIEQEALVNAVSSISSELDLEHVLTQIAEQLAIITSATSTYICSHDPETRVSQVTVEYFSSYALPQEIRSDKFRTYIENDSEFVELMRTNEYDMDQIDDPNIDPTLQEHMNEYGAKTILYIPIITKGEALGFAEIWDSKRKRIFKQEDIELCKTLCKHAAVAMENAQLFEKTNTEMLERKVAEEKLAVSEKYYRGLFENAHDAIILYDPADDKVLDVNQRACDLYGYAMEEFKELKLTDISNDVPYGKEQIRDIHSRKEYHKYETTHFKRDQTLMNLEVNASLVHVNGKPKIMSINRDITDRKMMEERLRHDAFHDSLTNLPNRSLFMDRLSQAIARQKRNDEIFFAVLFFDLDNFKSINDTLGHSYGDFYLIELGNRLTQLSREADTVARFGGDEFAVLVENIGDIKVVEEICNRILEIVGNEVEIQNNILKSTASIGVVIQKSNGTTADEIIGDADIAMYKAKDNGGNCYVIFDKGMRQDIHDRLLIKNNLEKALSNNEFSLAYQPIISLIDGSLFSIEALLRWNKPTGEIISPEQFIPFAERSGLIIPIGESVISKVIDQIYQWQSQIKFNNITISINISGVQLDSRQFSDYLLKQLKGSNLDTGLLSLEVTESAIIPNIQAAAQALNILNENGMNIYLDDFGVGYSSLSYLSQLPIRVLKIDRHFLDNIDRTENLKLIRTIISLGHEMGLSVVAEGIETPDQFYFMQELGCDYGQGHLFQEPTDTNTITEILNKGKIVLPERILF